MNNEKPRLVPARQGFSVLYKTRYLYSAYNPVQSCERLISSLNIIPHSLFLIFSPLLGYGIDLLLEKLDSGSAIIAIETDPVIYEFSLKHINPLILENTSFTYLLIKDEETGPSDLIQCIHALVQIQRNFYFRRVIVLTLSFASIEESCKASLVKHADSYIDNFWKNRITLVKMGRMYARNIFKNLYKLSSAYQLKKKSIKKPILVLGAGTSLDSLFPVLEKFKANFFVICVDSAIIPLLEHNIVPQLLIAVECQLANVKAFIGAKNSKIHIYSDLTSRPSITNIMNGKQSYFLSEYESSSFLNRIKKSFSLRFIPPLGSVGLTAVHTALYLRDTTIPIFLSGLDFCYQKGKTHCKSSPSHKLMLSSINRICPSDSYSLRFPNQIENVPLPSGNFITDPALKSYATLFEQEFSKEKHIYNLSQSSLLTSLPFITREILLQFIKDILPSQNNDNDLHAIFYEKSNENLYEDIKAFYENELNNLERIKDALIHKTLDEKELLHLLELHEYLYLHFPDGYKKPEINQAFLKRVRAEIDFFIKDIKSSLCRL